MKKTSWSKGVSQLVSQETRVIGGFYHTGLLGEKESGEFNRMVNKEIAKNFSSKAFQMLLVVTAFRPKYHMYSDE